MPLNITGDADNADFVTPLEIPADGDAVAIAERWQAAIQQIADREVDLYARVAEKYLRVLAPHLASAFYTEEYVYVNPEDATPRGVFFKPDGTKMYMVGQTSNTVYQYSLSTPWRVETATYDSVSFSVAAQDTVPTGLFFKSDGTKMYMIGRTNDTVYQYSLPTPWVLTGASYDTVSFSIAAQETSPQGMFFNPDGTKLFVIGTTNSTVYQYSLPTPWVLTAASYDSVSFLTVPAVSPGAMFFDPAMLKLFIVNSTTDRVQEYFCHRVVADYAP
jgi:sugar lactone lactonase YvrE